MINTGNEIPAPPERLKHAFKAMSAGDYIKLQFKSKEDTLKSRSAAFSTAHRLGFKIISKTQEIDGVFFLEVWRI